MFREKPYPPSCLMDFILEYFISSFLLISLLPVQAVFSDAQAQRL